MAYRGTGLAPFSGLGIGPLFGLRRELDRLFEGSLGGATGGRWSPAVDVREDDKGIDLDIELPGIRPEDVDISVDNGILTVSGEKRSDRQEEGEGKYHMVERTYGSFFRSFQLPQGVDESQISADFNNGVLTIRIPKAALPQPRRIQIGGQGEREVKGTATREPASSRTQSSSKGEQSGKGEQGSGERMAASGSERTESSKR